MCPSEPVSRIGSITVTTQLDFLTLVINAFSSRVDEYYESQIQFLKHINKLIKATIEIAEECVINRRRWMYKSCVKGITTKVKQASRQSIVEYEKLRKEAVWFAKHGVCSLDDMPSDVISALRQISVDAIMSELTAPGVEHQLIDCEKYCYTDPVVKNIIKKMDSWKTERGNSYQLGNFVARTDEERLHKNHSQHQLGKKSPFISKSWS